MFPGVLMRPSNSFPVAVRDQKNREVVVARDRALVCRRESHQLLSEYEVGLLRSDVWSGHSRERTNPTNGLCAKSYALRSQLSEK